MYRKFVKISFSIAMILIVGSYLLYSSRQNPNNATDAKSKEAEFSEDIDMSGQNTTELVQQPSAAESKVHTQNVPPSSRVEKDDLDNIHLTPGNFEDYVQYCFQGEKCVLDDDPMKMYMDFKASENRKANDSLISFMRSQLKNAKFRKRYQNMLKIMIDDFYPAEEKQFQEAAFYNYAGDLKKSLEVYQDLEKNSHARYSRAVSKSKLYSI